MSLWTRTRRKRLLLQVINGNCMQAFMHAARDWLTQNLQERYERGKAAKTFSTVVRWETEG